MDLPPFPRLKWDEYQWVGEAVLPAWAGFQERLGPYTELSSEDASDGTTCLGVNVPDQERPTPPSAEQAAAIRYLLERGDAVRDAILAADFRDYQVWRGNKTSARMDGTMPEIDRPDELRTLIGVGTVYVLAAVRDGAAYVGFEFGCNWDEEHGFGVLTHRDRVVAVDDAETAWNEALAAEDARRGE
ncbi:MAG TPA: hypothetical protein VKE40_09745 [Gemmataceae bacterium]|nr:hypothetical protein [Gemmataceae bacterium]